MESVVISDLCRVEVMNYVVINDFCCVKSNKCVVIIDIFEMGVVLKLRKV